MKSNTAQLISPLRASIYARISQDPKQTGLGVERQLEDCRAFCEERGWTVTAEYVDNDISAYSGKKRPQYAAMLEAIRAGKVDVVVAWHTDRLHRRLRDLVEYTDVVRDAQGHMKVATHTVKAGDIDLSTPSGIMIASIKGAVDEAYVSEAREKNKRGRLQIARKGGRHKCARVYGWEDDGQRLRESEAKVVREIINRLIKGQSPTSIAMELNSRNIPTARGSKWQGLNVRKTAERASNAGLRSHDGVLYQGDWEPIVDRATWEQCLLALKNRLGLKFKRGVGRKYLLTGFADCGCCGNKLSATVGTAKAKPAYRCKSYESSGYKSGSCGRVSRGIEPLEMLVAESILYRLDSPALARSLAQQNSTRDEVSGMLKERRAQQDKLDELIADYYSNDGILDRKQFMLAKTQAEAKLKKLEGQINGLTLRQTAVAADVGKTLPQTWESADLTWKRNLIELLIDRVEVLPYEPHAKVVWYEGFRFDPSRVIIHWLV